MANVVVVGAQWGDEGKGKIVDWLSEQADIVVRFQGGHNAGHTLVINGQTYKLALLPSGVLRPSKLAVIGNGVVFDPAAFLDEVERLKEQGVAVGPDNLRVAENVTLILPLHRELDALRETASAATAIGTTRRGIGPAYEDKARRTGVRAGDLRDPVRLAERVRAALSAWAPTIKALGGEVPTAEEILSKLETSTKRVLSLLANTSQIVDQAVREGKRVMLEGAQGTLLDIDHGTYPFVTSSSAVAVSAVSAPSSGAEPGSVVSDDVPVASVVVLLVSRDGAVVVGVGSSSASGSSSEHPADSSATTAKVPMTRDAAARRRRAGRMGGGEVRMPGPWYPDDHSRTHPEPGEAPPSAGHYCRRS